MVMKTENTTVKDLKELMRKIQQTTLPQDNVNIQGNKEEGLFDNSFDWVSPIFWALGNCLCFSVVC